MVDISVIVPVYNAENFLDRCVQSILNQSFANFELILIDDGSTDNSLQIIKKYENVDKRVRGFSNENSGPALTRNFGIEKSRADYVMFIDSDDYIDTGYLQNYFNAIKDRGDDLIIGGYKRVIGDKTKFVLKLKNDEFSKYVVTAPYCRIISKKFLNDNNIRFLDTNSSEDVYFNLMIYNKTNKISIINDVGYNYFYNKDSISNTAHKGFKKDIKIIELLDLINVNESYNLELNRYFIIRYVIWYLLYSGRTASAESFKCEYKRLFGWLADNIPDYKKNKYLSFFTPKGDPFKYRMIINVFMILCKTNLIGAFSKIYCKG